MKHWVNRISQSFRRSGKGPAAAKKPMDVPAPPASPAPPEPTAAMYDGFQRDIMPLLDALKNLPQDSAGKEFFLRADVVTRDMVEKPEDMRIDVWLFYTREIKPQPRMHEAPVCHLITMHSKRSTPENPDFSQLLSLDGAPVLRLCVRPQEDGERRITSHTYIERYEKPQAGRSYTIYSGDYGMVLDESPKTPHSRVKDFAAVINAWLQEHTPGHDYTLREAMNPKTEIDLLPPINIRKRAP